MTKMHLRMTANDLTTSLSLLLRNRRQLSFARDLSANCALNTHPFMPHPPSISSSGSAPVTLYTPRTKTNHIQVRSFSLRILQQREGYTKGKACCSLVGSSQRAITNEGLVNHFYSRSENNSGLQESCYKNTQHTWYVGAHKDHDIGAEPM